MVRRAVVLVLLLGAVVLGASVASPTTGYEPREPGTHEAGAELAWLAERPPARPAGVRLAPLLLLAVVTALAGLGQCRRARPVRSGRLVPLRVRWSTLMAGRAPPLVA